MAFGGIFGGAFGDGLGAFAAPEPGVTVPSLATFGLPAMGVPDLVPAPAPLIGLYQDHGDVDIVHLVIVRPFVPASGS